MTPNPASPSGEEKGEGRQRLVSNIVMMGMGEPLYNFEAVRDALNVVADGEGIAISKRRITLSTSGVVPSIARAGAEIGCMLAVSLHAVRDELRNELVPLNRKYPIRELLEACRNYPGLSNARRITFEYVMLKDVNDRLADAKALVRLLEGIPAKINLIPFNPWPGTRYECSDWEQNRELLRDRFQCRLCVAGAHAARARYPGGLRPAQERDREAFRPRAARAARHGDDGLSGRHGQLRPPAAPLHPGAARLLRRRGGGRVGHPVRIVEARSGRRGDRLRTRRRSRSSASCSPAPVLLVTLLSVMWLPGAIGILISEAFAIRSWMFHAGNGVVTAWIGWSLFGYVDDTRIPINQPLAVVAAGLAGRPRLLAGRRLERRLLEADIPPVEPAAPMTGGHKSVRMRIGSAADEVPCPSRRTSRHPVAPARSARLQIVLGATLAGCDNAATWLAMHGHSQVCRRQAPRRSSLRAIRGIHEPNRLVIALAVAAVGCVRHAARSRPRLAALFFDRAEGILAELRSDLSART